MSRRPTATLRIASFRGGPQPRLVPDRFGSFEFDCDVFCGDSQEDIDGTIEAVA